MLRPSKRIEERIECSTEFACDTGCASGSEIVVVPMLLFGAILMQCGHASHCTLAASGWGTHGLENVNNADLESSRMYSALSK